MNGIKTEVDGVVVQPVLEIGEVNGKSEVGKGITKNIHKVQDNWNESGRLQTPTSRKPIWRWVITGWRIQYG